MVERETVAYVKRVERAYKAKHSKRSNRRTRTKTLRILSLVLLTALSACRDDSTKESQAPTSTAGVFLPARAEDVRHRSRDSVREVTYVVAEPYPASTFLCELTTYLDQDKWQGLRDSIANAGTPSSLVSGWSNYVDATRTAESRVHSWFSSWTNDAGDVVSYALRYEYPETSQPDLTSLRVAAQFWPADVAQTLLGDRTNQLRTSRTPLVTQLFGVNQPRGCDTPAWSDFVTQKMANRAILALPFELSGVRSLDIRHDIDGLADRIAAALKTRLPALRVGTIGQPLSEASDAVLDFNVVCRCKEDGAPDGFYVREAVLYKPAITSKWMEPTRVLFYWSDAGSPAWKQVPRECFGQNPLSAACKTSFQNADIAFVTDLASALDNSRGSTK